MLGGLLRLPSRSKQLTEAHVSIGQVGEVVKEATAQLLGLVKLADVNQVDGAIGHLVEPRAIVIDDRSPAGARSIDWNRDPMLLFAIGSGRSFVSR